MGILFGKIKVLEGKIETFLDNIARSGMIFEAAIKDYLDNDREMFNERLKTIDQLESDADKLRREIKYRLYTQMLIPESRGDVLGLLENSDNVIDSVKYVLMQFDIENPEIPDFLKEDFTSLSRASVSAVEYSVRAGRAFFRDVSMINDHINKVFFYEHEADRLENRIKKKIFSSEDIGGLAGKMHIRDFAVHIARLSDEAESVCERLSVYAIKRTI